MKDEVRNPKDKSDKKNYRVHFREDSYGTMLKLMHAAGRNKFGDEFHLSERKMKQTMPHEVRRAGDQWRGDMCVHPPSQVGENDTIVWQASSPSGCAVRLQQYHEAGRRGTKNVDLREG